MRSSLTGDEFSFRDPGTLIDSLVHQVWDASNQGTSSLCSGSWCWKIKQPFMTPDLSGMYLKQGKKNQSPAKLKDI